jgi:hypothetical protein
LCRAFFIQEENMTNTTDTITTSTDNTTADFDAERAAFKRAAFNRVDTDTRPHNKAAVFDALAAAGITHVIVSFDGCGDSGQIESIEAKKGDDIVDLPGPQIDIHRTHWGMSQPECLVLTLTDAVEQLAYDCLEDRHGGWENNEGAYGEFAFDVAARTITLDYNERYIETANDQHVF